MSNFSKRSILASEIKLRKVLLDRYTPRQGRAIDFIQSFHRDRTPQGDNYWVSRYYKMYGEDHPDTPMSGTEMSYEDWEYIESLLPKTDSFLVDPENKEFIV